MIYLRKFMCLLAIASITSPPIFAAAPEEMRLKPSSKWNVQYADDSCRLARIFGEGDEQVLLFMDRYSPGDSFRLTLSGKPMETKATDRPLKVQFGPSEKEQKLEFYTGDLNKDTPSIIIKSRISMAPLTEEQWKLLAANAKSKSPIVMPVPRIDPARISAITYISVGQPLRATYILETGSMGKPMAALSACIDELITHWGVDVKRHATLSKHAVPISSPANWINWQDYPSKLLEKNQDGLVNFRLSIDDKGLPTQCHIQQTLRERGFDEAVCQSLMKRARFTPALDANNVPIASYYLSSVHFVA